MKKLIIANFKCNKTVAESVEWVHTVGKAFTSSDLYDVIVCPSFVALDAVARTIKESSYSLYAGAQDVSPFDLGAYTGAVGAKQLVGMAEYVLVGHSERRRYFGETNQSVLQKVEQCLYYQLKPIVLIRDEQDTIPGGIEYFAWEPVSAIGTGNAIDSGEAARQVQALKNKHSGVYGMYGGSVNTSSIGSYMLEETLFGVVIGSAALDPHNFLEMIRAIH